MTTSNTNTAQDTTINTEVVEMVTEIVTEVDKEKGINQPGLTRGHSYVDSNGNVRHKFETLSTLSSNTINTILNHKGQSDEKAKKVIDKQEENINDEKEPDAVVEPTTIHEDTEKADDTVVEKPTKRKTTKATKSDKTDTE